MATLPPIQASTVPQASPPDGASLELALFRQDGTPLDFTVGALALTPALGLGQSPAAIELVNVMGVLRTIDSVSNTATTNQTVAYVCCDPPAMTDPSGMFAPDAILNHLMSLQVKPKAILLYSLIDDYCGIGGVNTYSSVLTMTNSSSASLLLRYSSQGSSNASATTVVISGNVTSSLVDPTDLSSGPRIDIAMSLLYTFTALVTVLFLAVIITGAVRAHRYPERYGPRSGRFGGRRQSRAKGLARAVLDTLPIVKFHQSTTDFKLDRIGGRPSGEVADDGNAKTSDGLQSGSAVLSAGTDSAERSVRVMTTAEEDHAGSHTVEPVIDGAVAQTEMPAANSDEPALRATSAIEYDQRPGCSICTENFQEGEDVRVLPCNHRFHPGCVDVWLIGVSGTCPLCRLDLRGTSPADDRDGLPPPIDLEGGGESAGWSAGRRRLSRMLDWGRLRAANDEERIATLRWFGAQRRRDGQDGDARQRAGVTAWLRDRLGARPRERHTEEAG